ncbi:hypothetical protein [Protofrankia symbiont of Coriaria ruscifolia]|uniref:hypothetical protein n=1 Tax=Protofrankia symbiont of Coriaria ruscifolia TaxID=1306542 RepID=UPI001040F280|nr:hypothetical protein [Protofrankia symbiont of Coriaria ruscifolia]
MAQRTGRGCHPRRGRRRGRAVSGLGGLRRRPAGRPGRARALLAAGLVLPVLDGLDEIDEIDEIHSGGRDQALMGATGSP